MFNRHIAVSLVSIVGAIAIMTGGTMAYFTAQADSASNQFKTGTMNVSVTQDNVVDNVRLDTDSWQPGQTITVPFSVNNTGTLPVNLKADVTGSWGNSTLDAGNVVKVTEVDYWNGSTWIPFATNVTGEVYFSPNGLDANLMPVGGGATQQFQAKVMLDPSADSTYAGATFTATLHVTAGQTNDSSF